MLDSGCSGTFSIVEHAKKAGLLDLGPSNTLIETAATDGGLQSAKNETCLLYKGIPKEVLGGQTMPGFRYSLIK